MVLPSEEPESDVSSNEFESDGHCSSDISTPPFSPITSSDESYGDIDSEEEEMMPDSGDHIIRSDPVVALATTQGGSAMPNSNL